MEKDLKNFFAKAHYYVTKLHIWGWITKVITKVFVADARKNLRK